MDGSRETDAAMAKRILVVDDDPDILALIRTSLKEEGYEVETAANGHECLERIKINPPDALILDILMPGINGGQVAKQLKSDPQFATIPIIIVTAVGEKKFVKAAIFDLGVVHYLVKPFDPHDLLEKLAQTLSPDTA